MCSNPSTRIFNLATIACNLKLNRESNTNNENRQYPIPTVKYQMFGRRHSKKKSKNYHIEIRKRKWHQELDTHPRIICLGKRIIAIICGMHSQRTLLRRKRKLRRAQIETKWTNQAANLHATTFSSFVFFWTRGSTYWQFL